MNAQEIVELYATGQRDFSHVKLVQAWVEANLTGATLDGANIDKAGLSRTDRSIHD